MAEVEENGNKTQSARGGAGKMEQQIRIDNATTEEVDLPLLDLFNNAYFARLHLIS
jgi:hypothetical protein